MEIVNLRLKGLKLIKPKVFCDTRGFFLESYQMEHYHQLGITTQFVQDNHSFSQQHTIRGMHFQTIPGQAKLIRVAEGEIFDVAVDIRPESPTFGDWEAVILNGSDHYQLFIPIGFAHGFCVLSKNAHVMYKTSSKYNSETEIGFMWNDPTINIQWPTNAPHVSERDLKAPLLNDLGLR